MDALLQEKATLEGRLAAMHDADAALATTVCATAQARRPLLRLRRFDLLSAIGRMKLTALEQRVGDHLILCNI